MDALLNMSETINFPKKHISINILNFQPKLEQLPHNLDDELITLKKDVPRLIYFQYTKNDIFKKTNLKLKIKEFEQLTYNFIKQHQKFYNYSYYQGYLDIATFYYLIMGSNKFNKVY